MCVSDPVRRASQLSITSLCDDILAALHFIILMGEIINLHKSQNCDIFKGWDGGIIPYNDPV